MKYKKHTLNLLGRQKEWESRQGKNKESGHEHKKPGSEKS